MSGICRNSIPNPFYSSPLIGSKRSGTLKEFDVYIQNKPGELSKICELLGNQGVNIKAIASERAAKRPLVKIVTDDEVTAKAALSRVPGISYELKEVIVVKLPDKPGELAKVTKRLAKAAINVDSIYILGKEHGITEMVLTVDDPKKAEGLLR